jgi:hypothetical protein
MISKAIISAARGVAPIIGGGGSAYRDLILSDSPHNYWRLGENSGATVAVDEVGNNNGTYSGAGTLGTPGLIGLDSNKAVTRALADGTVMSPGLITAYNAIGAFTVECWAKITAFSYQNYAFFVCSGNPFAGMGFYLGLNGSDHVDFSLRYTTDPAVVTSTRGALNDSLRHHFVGRFTGTKLAIFIDGVKEGEIDATGVTEVSPASDPNLKIGPQLLGSSWGLDATIDEVALYTYALSDAQILSHYNSVISNSGFNDFGPCIMQCLAAQLSGFSDGDLVDSVYDTSTGGSLPLTTPYDPVTYKIVSGKPVVRCLSGSQQLGNAVDLSSGEHTFIGRARMVPGGSAGRIFTADYGGAGSNWLMGWWTGHMDDAYCNGQGKLDGPADDNTFRTYALMHSSGTTVFYGPAGLVHNIGIPCAGPNRIGINITEASDADFVGLVIYSGALPASVIANVMALMDTF